jgi:tetratricopeptide (TPR) repeat protein
VAQTLENLGELFQIQARYSEAESLYQRSLALREKGLPPDHPDLARTLKRLASLYCFQGRPASAEPLYRRALKILEKSLGANHPDSSLARNNLADCLRAHGKYDSAESLYLSHWPVWKKASDPTIWKSPMLSVISEISTAMRADSAEPSRPIVAL